MELVPDALALLREQVQGPVGSGKLPFLGVQASVNGQEVINTYAGESRPGVAADGNTILRFFSMTKPITSVSIMQLRERGLLDLDDPLSKHIPEWVDASECSKLYLQVRK
jgi:CubicO group peptidase (beta-lactamase class C family)